MGKNKKDKIAMGADTLLRRLVMECGRHNVSASAVMWAGLRLAGAAAEQISVGDKLFKHIEQFALEITEGETNEDSP